MPVVRVLLTLLALMVACWACLEAAPGDPVERAARVAGVLPAPGVRVSEATRARVVDAVAEQRGIGRTALARLWSPGKAWRDGRSVSWHVRRALPVTLGLLAGGLGLSIIFGFPLAFASAWRPGGAADRWAARAASLLLALPVAWAALLVLRVAPGRGGWALPVLCMGYVGAALVARYARAALVGELSQPHVQASRARGASRWRAIVVHALRASGAPLLAILPTLVAYFLGAAVVVERAFDLRGLGALLLDASASGDAPIVTGCVLVAGALVALSTLLAQTVAPLVDPRLRR